MRTPKAPPKPQPKAAYLPGGIYISLPDYDIYRGERLVDHKLTREQAVAIRDQLNVALEHQAAVTAVLSS